MIWGLASVLACSAIFALLAFTPPQETFWTPDNGGKFIQLKNLRWQAGLDLSVDYPGRGLDPQFLFDPFPDAFSSIREGEVWLQWSPFLPLVSLPFYNLLGYPGLRVLPLASGVGCLVMLLLLCRKRGWAPLSLLVVGLATPLAFYSAQFWEHTPAVFMALLFVWVLVKAQRGGGWPFWIIAALLISAAAALRQELYLALPAALIALLACPLGRGRSWRPVLLLLGSSVLVTVPVLTFFWFTGGRLFPANVAYLFYPLNYLKRVGWLALPNFFVGAEIDAGIRSSLVWRTDFMIAAMLAIVGVLLRRRFLRAVWIVVTFFEVFLLGGGLFLLDTTHRSVHGFLILCPLLLFAWVPGEKDRPRTAVDFMRTLGTLYLVFYAISALLFRWRGPNGGLEWGPRYLLLIYPLLIPPAFEGLGWLLRSSRGKVLKAIYLTLFFLLLAVSVAYQARGAKVLLQDRQLGQQRIATLQALAPENVVTDLWWLPLDGASQFYKRRFFFSPLEQLPQWIALADQQGVNSFCLVRLGFLPPDQLAAMAPPGRTLALQRVDQAGYVVFMTVRIERR